MMPKSILKFWKKVLEFTGKKFWGYGKVTDFDSFLPGRHLVMIHFFKNIKFREYYD